MPHPSKRGGRRRRSKQTTVPWRVLVDGSYHWPTQQMFYAAVVHDPSGRVIARRLGCQDGGDSAMAEALGALLGVTALRELHDGRPPARWELIGDHRGLIVAINAGTTPVQRLAPYVREICALKGSGTVRWVPRERNHPAHWTADQRDRAIPGVVCELDLCDRQQKADMERDLLASEQRKLRFGNTKARNEARRAIAQIRSGLLPAAA